MCFVPPKKISLGGLIPVLNMIRFPDRDPTGFSNSEPDPDRTGFRKNANVSDMCSRHK